MEYLITKKDFIETYLDDMKVIEIIEDLGSAGDDIEYDDLVSMVNEAYSEALDKYVCEEDGLVHEVNFRTFDEDVIHKLHKKIGE